MVIAYVDDSEFERNRVLPLFLSEFQKFNIPVHRFDFFENGTAFLESWTPDTYDLIILDIFMGELSGIDVANEIRKVNKEVRIVFCSTSNEYANESYDVNACYYIQKPVSEKSISQMINRLNIEDFELRRYISLPDEQRVTLRNILFSEYSNHAIEIHTKKGDNIKTWLSQAAFEKILEPYDFFLSPSRGIIVNLYEVEELSDDVFIMSDGSYMNISRRKKKETIEAYNSFLLHSLREEM